MLDLYFMEKYGLLYEEIERGKCEIFEHHSALGTVRHLFIKRQAPVMLEGEAYYEGVTPYGYGGPVIMECDIQNKGELVNEFEEAFGVYCRENRIVSEFVRFHPVLMNAQDFSGCYDLTLRRRTTGTNLKDYEDPVKNEFSKSKQKSIRKSLEAGVAFRVTQNPDDLESFKEIYHSTMKRKQADEVYFFDSEYFRKLLHYLGEHVLLVEVEHEGEVIGMGLNFIYGKMIHIHLSGTDDHFHHLAPSVMMRYALVKWGKDNGIDLIHEGGGKSGSLDDPLYIYKKQFGRNTDFDYFVGSKVWDEKVYKMLDHSVNAEIGKLDTPAYR